jgi:glycine/D-amino acid oxidase-like deaminating enzyme
MKKVAVVGGGIFGSLCALKLRLEGYDVELFESHDDILKGSTSKSVLRIHQGLHYPRHLNTALQSLKGYESFMSLYSGETNTSFDNFYALSKTDSKTTPQELRSFVTRLGGRIAEVDKEMLASRGVDVTNIGLVYMDGEGVIDIELFASRLKRELISLGVKLNLNHHIRSIFKTGSNWNLNGEGISQSFRYVVLATYGRRPKIEGRLVPKPRVLEFHKTLTIEIESKIEPFGLTIIDGDFLTLLPRGNKTHRFLAYCPSPSLLETFVGEKVPAEWFEGQGIFVTEEQLEHASFAIIERIRQWIPSMFPLTRTESLVGFRAIKPYVHNTDERESNIEEIEENLFEVISGKIDHGIQVSNRLIHLLQEK